MAHSSVGIVVVVVFLVILLFVAFGCNGGLARLRPEAYVALAQKKKTVNHTSDKPPVLAPEPVTLLDATAGGCPSHHADQPKQHAQTPQTAANFATHTYNHDTQQKEDRPQHRGPHLPKSGKAMESLAGGDSPPDTSKFDANKMSHETLHKRHAMSGHVQRQQYNSRDGANRILGYNNLLRPWNEDFVKAQRRACKRREAAQKQKDCGDDTCVQFNESSFMYEACIDK